MPNKSQKREASCSCGQLSLITSGNPVRISICHCFECQKRSGSVFATQVRFPRYCIEIQGEFATYTRTADSGNQIHFQFCRKCGGTISYYLDEDPDNLAVPIGLFSDPSFPQPVYSVYEERMHHWVQLPEGMEHIN